MAAPLNMPQEIFVINADHVPVSEKAIRKLFLNVLDRAKRDLLEGEGHHKRAAAKWFRKWKNTLPESISFRDVCEVLEFQPSKIEKLLRNIGVTS